VSSINDAGKTNSTEVRESHELDLTSKIMG